MKLCTFEVLGSFTPIERLGVITPGGRVADLNMAYATWLDETTSHPRAYEVADATVPSDLMEFLENGRTALDAASGAIEHFGSRLDETNLIGPDGECIIYDPEEVRLLAPLPRPNSMRDCLAFEEHLKNSMRGREIPPVWYEIPIYYKGNADTVQGTDREVIWPAYTQMLDYELEFAAIIGTEGVDISKEDAWSHIAGFTVFNDVSARDIQMKEMAGMLGPAKGKDMDGGNILGPVMVTADEWDPRAGHAMIARVNGEEWSRGSTASMHHDFGTIISYISMGETLHVGDVIGSGTVGTGCGLELGRFPQPGDTIELEVEGIGVLRNRFVKP